MKDIQALQERAKELRCLYSLEEIISDRQETPARVFRRVLETIPSGWRHPDSTGACIEYLGRRYVGPGFASEGRTMSQPITLWRVEVGRVTVSDRDEPALSDPRSFLLEEVELLQRIAARLAEYLESKHSEMLGERPLRTRNHWAWRQWFAEAIAEHIDSERFGVSRMFIGGSTARGEASSGSDIDLYVDCHGSEEQKMHLTMWLEGWSLCLAEVALQQTGEEFPHGILNVHWLKGQPGVWQRGELHELTLGGAKSGS